MGTAPLTRFLTQLTQTRIFTAFARRAWPEWQSSQVVALSRRQLRSRRTVLGHNPGSLHHTGRGSVDQYQDVSGCYDKALHHVVVFVLDDVAVVHVFLRLDKLT